MDPEKVKTVVNWETPNNVKGVRSFLGFVNFFRRFLKDHGRIQKLLVRLTKKNMPFKFGQTELNAFQDLKNAVATEPVLRKWDPELETRTETDASNGDTGGALMQ